KDEFFTIPAGQGLEHMESYNGGLVPIEDSKLYSGGERRLSFLKFAELTALELKNAEVVGSGIKLQAETATSTDIDRHRHRAEMLKEREDEYQGKLSRAKGKLQDLFNSSGLEQNRLRELSDRKKEIEKRLHEEGISDKVKQVLEAELESLPCKIIRQF